MHSHSGSVIVGASNSNHSDGCLSDAITHAEVVYKCSEPDESHERDGRESRSAYSRIFTTIHRLTSGPGDCGNVHTISLRFVSTEVVQEVQCMRHKSF